MTDDEVLLTRERAHPQSRSAAGFVAFRRVSTRRAYGGWPTRGGEAHHGRDQPRSCTEAQSWNCWLRMRAAGDARRQGHLDDQPSVVVRQTPVQRSRWLNFRQKKKVGERNIFKSYFCSAILSKGGGAKVSRYQSPLREYFRPQDRASGQHDEEDCTVAYDIVRHVLCARTR